MRVLRTDARFERNPRRILCILFFLATPACAPNSYATAKTLAPGKVRMTVAPEYGEEKIVKRVYGEPFPTRKLEEKEWSLITPAVLVRVGIAKNVDIGARVGYAGGIDVKVRAIDTRFIAVAVDPTVRTLKTGMFDIPLIVGLKLHERFEIVASPGVAFAIPALDGNNGSEYAKISATLLRASVGARLGLTNRFYIHPEVTTFRSVAGTEITWNGAGLGFSIESTP